MIDHNSSIAQAAEFLQQGRPVIFPTDTVYGLGVSALHAQDPSILFALKQRPSAKPVAWLVSGASDLTRFGVDVPSWACNLAAAYWPGPLTLVVKASDSVPAAFASAQGTIALRMPDNTVALELIQAAKAPLATTSANISGTPAPALSEQIDSNLAAAVAAVIVDDSEKSGVSSTVLDCTQDQPVVLREGDIKLVDIRAMM